MNALASANGVKQGNEVGADVQHRRNSAESQVDNDKNSVNSSGNSARTDYNRLQNEHEQGNKNFNEAKIAEEKRQSDKIGDNSIGRNDLNRIKDELQDKFNKE
jgi:conjugal transfer mating pair stabilization protein TraG